MSEVIVMPSSTETELIINQCREYYTNVQRTWYFFAKSLKDIRDKDIYKVEGAQNLKEFCTKEFPSINYSTIIKTIRVVERFGPLIEAKLEANPNYTLPAYESCYQLICAEDKISGNKHKDLIKKIFDEKFPFYRFREEMKKIIGVEAAKSRAKIGATEEALEEELLDEIDMIEEIDDDDLEVKGTDISKTVEQSSVRSDFLRDNLPMLEESIKKNPDIITDNTVDFAENLDDLRIKIDSFLDAMQEVCGE